MSAKTAVRVTSADDPTIAKYSDIRDPELLRSHGLFVAEGRLVVQRVLADARYDVVSVLVNDAAFAALRPVIEQRGAPPHIAVCDTALFQTIAGFNVHRGCLALVRRPPPSDWRDAVGDSTLAIVLEGVTNADNVGGVFRNAAAFGAGALLLSPACCDPLYRKAMRTSMGSVLRVPFARLEPWPDALDELRASGWTLVALSPRAPSISLDAFTHAARPPRVALLVGAEGSGLSEAAEARADVRVRIPISGEVDSLNLAVATGIALARLASAE